MKTYWGVFLIFSIGFVSFFLFRQNIRTFKKSSPSIQSSEEATLSGKFQNKQAMNKQYNSPPKMVIDLKKKHVAILTTTKGTMRIELFPQEAPNTVNNFVFLAREGFYNDTVFHRIIKDFMIQGGDPTGTGRGGPGYRFADEPIKRPYTRGTIAMANAGPNTNGSQFFVMHKDYNLQKNYVIFGKIPENDTESLTTLDAIAQTPVTMSESGEQSKPVEKVTLARVDIEEQ